MRADVKAIFFDMDDTLYPEKQYVLSGFRAVAEWAESELGVDAEQGFTRLRTMFEQGIRGNTFNRLLSDLALDEPDLVAQMVTVYRQHLPTLTPFPEVLECLPRLQRRFTLGLVSDGYLGVQQKKWAALGLAHYFNAVVFSDVWGPKHWKPDQRPYKAALVLCEANAAETIYVGDNPEKDFIGAKELGIITVMVRRPEAVYREVAPPSPAHAPDIVISDLTELLEKLENV